MSNHLCELFIQTIQKRLFRAMTMFQLTGVSGIKAIDGSDKMVLALESTAARSSDRILVTDTTGLSEMRDVLFYPQLTSQPRATGSYWVVPNEASPGAPLMPMMPMKHLIKANSPVAVNMWIL